MTVEIEGCTPHEEDTRVGSTVRMGEAVVEPGDMRVGDPVEVLSSRG